MFRDCREPFAKIHPVTPKNHGDDCCICLSPLHNRKNIILSGCAHNLHVKCIKSWLATGSASCPLCMEDQTKLKQRLSL